MLCFLLQETQLVDFGLYVRVTDLILPPLQKTNTLCQTASTYSGRKTLYRLPPLSVEDGRGLRRANISRRQPKETQHLDHLQR